MSDMDWAAAQHMDECLRMQQVDEILRAAEKRPLAQEEIRILAAEAGLGELYMNRNQKD